MIKLQRIDRSSIRSNTFAIFDFDNTIITIDSYRDFFAYHFGGIKVYTIHLLAAPVLMMAPIFPRINSLFKLLIIFIFLRNCPNTKFKLMCEDYAFNRIPSHINPEALSKIRWHQQQNHRVVIVSASLREWIEPYTKQLGIDDVIATNVEIKNNNLTGNIQKPFYYGVNKLKVFKDLIIDPKQDVIYAYGDSRSDLFLLRSSTFQYYRKFW